MVSGTCHHDLRIHVGDVPFVFLWVRARFIPARNEHVALLVKHYPTLEPAAFDGWAERDGTLI